MRRDIAAAVNMYYFALQLSLLIIAVVTVFVTILELPPVLLICIVYIFALSGGLYCAASDKSIMQKRE